MACDQAFSRSVSEVRTRSHRSQGTVKGSVWRSTRNDGRRVLTRETPTFRLSPAPSRAWAGEDSNLRRLCRQIYSLLPLATRAPTRGRTRIPFSLMPTFDVVSEVDMQE